MATSKLYSSGKILRLGCDRLASQLKGGGGLRALAILIFNSCLKASPNLSSSHLSLMLTHLIFTVRPNKLLCIWWQKKF